ncbi:hypothetical protein [Halorarum salinum]|nr:hypothetical protein [Halobaculum salinum]
MDSDSRRTEAGRAVGFALLALAAVVAAVVVVGLGRDEPTVSPPF